MIVNRTAYMIASMYQKTHPEVEILKSRATWPFPRARIYSVLAFSSTKERYSLPWGLER